MSEQLTGYERMLKAQAEKIQLRDLFITTLADNYYNDPLHIAKKSYDKGLTTVVEEIEGWQNLLVKALNEIPYANPKEAEREHNNTMNLLNVIKNKLIKLRHFE